MVHGGFWIKIHGGKYQQNGIPDLIGCYEGYFVALEVKVPGKEDTVTRLQEQTMKEIRAAGGLASMVTSVEEAVEVIRILDRLIEEDEEL